MRRTAGIRKRKLNVSSNSIEIERGETSTVQKKVRVKQTNGAVSVECKIMPDEEMMQSMVMWLRTHSSSVSNTPKIVNFMEETFVYREIQQNKNKFQCASDVLKEYPRYVDVEQGFLILQDFKRKYPASNPAALNKKFLSKFSSTLVKLVKRKGESIPKCSDECLRSLVLTLQLLPSVNNVKKASFDSKLGRLFLFVKENECISTLAEKKDSTYHKQPFLVVTGTMEHPISFNLVIDKTVIPLGCECSRAFNVLFASFFIFRLEYPKYLDKFFIFFEQFVFEIFLSKNNKISASNQDFVNVLEHIAGDEAFNS